MGTLKSSVGLPAWAWECSNEELDELLARYGWFGPLRILREVRTGRPDARAAVTAPWRAQSTLRQLPADIAALTADPDAAEPVSEPLPQVRPAAGSLSADELIDRFLQQTDLRIVAEEGEPETEVLTEPSFGEDDEVVSERLAEIYLAQGLHDRAASIYRKLSLRNPEKSIYFAELIAKIGNNN